MRINVRFTKLDLKHVYQKLLLEESFKNLVTINTQQGLYRPNRLLLECPVPLPFFSGPWSKFCKEFHASLLLRWHTHHWPHGKRAFNQLRRSAMPFPASWSETEDYQVSILPGLHWVSRSSIDSIRNTYYCKEGGSCKASPVHKDLKTAQIDPGPSPIPWQIST